MIGKEILNYTIISLIGQGGMGSVYLAQNKYINQQKVAIKVINADMINDFTRKIFVQEAEKLASLQHPNIVRFYNYHIDDAGNIYMVMEYADGYSLEDYIKNVSGLIVEDRVCSFFEPLLDAFDYAHRHKIIHKDIKPSNIIITNEGIPKVLDFGIASIFDEKNVNNDNDNVDSGGNELADGMIMGTPSYMSPEQVKGGALDQRSDIYSLGVLLHQMLTGNPPYDTTTLTEHDIYKHVVNDELPRMKAYYKYVSDKVQAIVDKATNKKPEARYQNCQDFKRALHNAIYPPKIPTWAKAGIGAAVAALLVGVFFIWDYNRVKVSYFKDYAEQWGIPQGIAKVSASQRKHMHRMYRFESRHYKLQRVSHVNSLGIIIPESESERYERPIDVLFFYTDGKRLSRAKVMDQNGQVKYIKSYNENLQTVVFQVDDDFGTEKSIGSETVGYVDAFASNQNRGKISRYLLEYDEKGYVKTLRYAGFQNVVVGDANGIYGKQYVRDSKGRVLEEMYLAHDGSPKATSWGMGKKIFTYDEDDNWKSARYVTVDGEPALDAADGTSLCENEYDKYGNAIAQYYKTSDGQLMLPGMSGVAGVLYEYDDRGFITKQSFIGIDGAVEFSTKQGFAISKTESNEYGFFKRISFFDANERPCMTEEGLSSVKIVTDARGNELERWNYNLNNEYVLTPDGYAGMRAEYDSLGHLVKVGFFGADGNPCLVNTGYSAIVRDYDRLGEMIKESYLDTLGAPTVNDLGISTAVYERDLRGNITKVSFFDEEGQPSYTSEGLSVYELLYDDNGNEIQRSFFDTEGKPTKGFIGFAQRKHTYDEQGHELSDRFYNEKGELTLVDGIAGMDYIVDTHGNIIEETPVGINGKLAPGRLVTRNKYDGKDNVIEVAFFGAEGKPAMTSYNFHKYTQAFNDRNQCIETCYYDTTGELTSFSNSNYCIERDEYNERGLKVRVSYFDKNGDPAVYQGSQDGDYSSLSSEYDSYGRVVRQYFYDKDGNPTDPRIMVPEGAVEYDKWGNVIYLASMDGLGHLIMNPKTGWSFTRSEYDSKSNLLWTAYFDDNENPIRCQEGYHKLVKTYTDGNNLETDSYYDTDGSPAVQDGYHQQRYKYDENNLCTEIGFYGKNGSLVNASYGFARVTFSYNNDQSYKDRKFYSASGVMLQQEMYVNGSWEPVRNWQKDVTDQARFLPTDLGSDMKNLIFKSARVVGSSKVEAVFVTPKSKYDMSTSMISEYQSIVNQFATYLRREWDLPRSVSLVGILQDSKGRELSRITK